MDSTSQLLADTLQLIQPHPDNLSFGNNYTQGSDLILGLSLPIFITLSVIIISASATILSQVLIYCSETRKIRLSTAKDLNELIIILIAQAEGRGKSKYVQDGSGNTFWSNPSVGAVSQNASIASLYSLASKYPIVKPQVLQTFEDIINQEHLAPIKSVTEKYYNLLKKK